MKHVTSMLKFAKLAASALVVLCGSVTASYCGWRQDLGTFRIGLIENEANKLSPAELQRIQTAYAQALAMPVEIIRVRDYPALIDAHASARVEYAIYSAASYATAYLVCECIEPLVQPVSVDGSLGTRTVLLLDASVKPSQIGQSKGIAVPGRSSPNGFGVPLAADKIFDAALSGSEPWLKFVPDTNSAASAYITGTVDGFFASVGNDETLVSALQPGNPLSDLVLASPRKTKAVWLSKTIANGPHAVRKNLANEAKDSLLNFLVTLAQTNSDLNDILLPANDVRFMPVSHGAYATAISATKMLAAQARLPAR